MAPLLAALTGLGLFLSFPPAALGPLAFVALAPLLLTVYTRVGDLFAWLAAAGSAGAGLWRWRQGEIA